MGRLVVLRAPEASDVSVLMAMRNDVSLQIQLMGTPRPADRVRLEGWLRRRLDDERSVFYVVADRRGGRARGFVQLADVELLHRRAEVGIALAATARGHGRADEAIRLIEDHATAVLGLRKLFLKCLASNERALALYGRTGYRRVGVLRGHFYHSRGFHDVVLMEKMLASRPR